jgi:hypothetical protein
LRRESQLGSLSGPQSYSSQIESTSTQEKSSTEIAFMGFDEFAKYLLTMYQLKIIQSDIRIIKKDIDYFKKIYKGNSSEIVLRIITSWIKYH